MFLLCQSLVIFLVNLLIKLRKLGQMTGLIKELTNGQRLQVFSLVLFLIYWELLRSQHGNISSATTKTKVNTVLE